MTGFKPVPLQGRKREGNKLGVLLYQFDQCGDSIPHFIYRLGVKNYSILLETTITEPFKVGIGNQLNVFGKG